MQASYIDSGYTFVTGGAQAPFLTDKMPRCIVLLQGYGVLDIEGLEYELQPHDRLHRTERLPPNPQRTGDRADEPALDRQRKATASVAVDTTGKVAGAGGRFLPAVPQRARVPKYEVISSRSQPIDRRWYARLR